MACSPRRLAFALVVALQAACFSDPPTIGGTGATGGTCAVGSLGCACTSGNGCDVGLQCLVSAGVCIDVDCTPGDGMCSCGGGMSCADGFVCVDDYCQPIGSSSTTGATDPSGATLPPTSSGTTFDSADSADVGPPVTSGSNSTSITMSDGTTVGSPCHDCLTQAAIGDCAGLYANCTCDETFQCFANQWSPMCCDDYPPPTIQWNAFAMCASNCVSDCGPMTCAFDEVGETLQMDLSW